MLLVANFAKIKNDAKKTENDRNPGTWVLIRVLSDSYPMDTNMTGLRWFSKISVLVLGQK